MYVMTNINENKCILFLNFVKILIFVQKVILASKHKKEEIMAPILKSCGLEVVVPNEFDTDQWGTFDGEVERKNNPLETAKIKCLAALDKFDYKCGISSEGSFGPHPYLGLVTANEEWVYFIDKANDLEIWSKAISTDTNFDQKEVKRYDELFEFSSKVGFPSHGLILSGVNNDHFFKGIVDTNALKTTFERLIKDHESVLVQTDMRACFNPKRMKVIAEATKSMADKIRSKCPKCQTPGFQVSEVIDGLPCSSCHQPTKSILKFIYTCKKCSHIKEELFPHQKEKEDPMYCNHCNP